MGKKLELEIFGTSSKPTFDGGVSASVASNEEKGESLLRLTAGYTELKIVIELEWHWITLGGDQKRAKTNAERVWLTLFKDFDGIQVEDDTKRKQYVDKVKAILTDVMTSSKRWPTKKQ
jgi:hypothetical protein